MKLEAELGARLFDRLSKSARLTPFGAAFLPKAERILRELSEAKTEILEMNGKDKGEVSVGRDCDRCAIPVAAGVEQFSRQHSSDIFSSVAHTFIGPSCCVTVFGRNS